MKPKRPRMHKCTSTSPETRCNEHSRSRSHSQSGNERHRMISHSDSSTNNALTTGTRCLWEKEGKACDFIAQDAADLTSHMESVHSEEGNVCYWKNCYRKGRPIVSEKTILIYHFRLHTGDRPFECVHCSSTYPMDSLLRKHVKESHPKTLVKDENRPFFCYWEEYEREVCPFVAASAGELTSHILFDHIRQAGDLGCYWQNCCLNFKQFKCTRQLIGHFRGQHNKDDRPFQCTECPRAFALRIGLDHHIREDHPGVTPQIRCYWMPDFSMCTQVCQTTTELDDHIEEAHTEGIKKRICRWNGCFREFQEDQDYVCHLASHTGEKSLKCSLCKERFPREELAKHQRETHSETLKMRKLLQNDQTLRQDFFGEEDGDEFEQELQSVEGASHFYDAREFAHEQRLMNYIDKNHSETMTLCCLWRTEYDEKCMKICESSAELTNHIVSDHMKNQTEDFCCWEDCNHRFLPSLKKSQLIAHIEIHTENRAHTEFDREFANEQDLQGNNRQFGCTACPKKYATKKGLKEHIKKAHPGGIMTSSDRAPENTCLWMTDGQVCSLSFQSPVDLFNHTISIHELNKSCLWKNCEKSDKLFSNPYNLKDHLQKHANYAPHKCLVCQKTYINDIRLARHRRDAHPETILLETIEDYEPEMDQSMILEFRCLWRTENDKVCMKWYTTSAELTNHIVADHQMKDFCRWEDCNHKFQSLGYSQFISHVQIHTDNRAHIECHREFVSEQDLQEYPPNTDFTCLWMENDDVCMLSYETSTELTQHICFDHNKEPNVFFCLWENCGRTCQNKASFHLHLQTHFDDRPFGCTACRKKYATEKGLNKHIKKVHPGDTMTSNDGTPENTCLWMTDGQICSQSFQTPVDLFNHTISFHTLTEFCLWKSCKKNGRPFSNPYKLKDHLQQVHAKYAPHECSVCRKTYINDTRLARHRQQAHPETIEEPEMNGILEFCCSWRKDDLVCMKVHTTSAELMHHIVSDHRMEEFCRWDDCEHSFIPSPDYSQYICHMQTHAENRALIEWNTEFEQDSDGNTEPSPNMDFTCLWTENDVVCMQSHETSAELTHHILFNHSMDANAFVCRWENCWRKLRSCNNNSQFRIHFQAHFHGKPFGCTACSNQYATKQSLKNHVEKSHPGCIMTSNDGTPENTCLWMTDGQICSLSFQTPVDLFNHTISFHELNKSCLWKNCEKSDKLFLDTYSLKAHLKSHAKYAPDECSVCQKTFSNGGNLARHKQTAHPERILPETIEEPVRCLWRTEYDKVCMEWYTTSAELANHIVADHQMKDFCRWEDCKHIFDPSLENLQFFYHVQSHTKNRPRKECHREVASEQEHHEEAHSTAERGHKRLVSKRAARTSDDGLGDYDVNEPPAKRRPKMLRAPSATSATNQHQMTLAFECTQQIQANIDSHMSTQQPTSSTARQTNYSQ